ncbi:MAG: glutamate racemase [Eubacteriales bacterium]|nr:glutamate racemase [Eubacteriales bacterium]
MNSQNKVAVFDSGLGGISVLRELKKTLPHEDFVYFGDSGNAPYGVRTRENIQELCKGVIDQIIAEEGSVKCVVIACNTATSAAIDYLRTEFPDIEFIGIEPAIEWAVTELENPLVLTFATNFTVNGELFKNNVERLKDRGTFVSMGAPNFVTYVESGVSDSNMNDEVREYIDSLCSGIEKPVDAVVLGCTHFPFIKNTIKEEVDKTTGGNARLFDAAVLVAKKTKKFLEDNGNLNDQTEEGTVKMLNSDPSKIDFMWKLYES